MNRDDPVAGSRQGQGDDEFPHRSRPTSRRLPVHRPAAQFSSSSTNHTGLVEAFLNAIKYPGFQLSKEGQILWSNAATARELDIGLTREIFDLILPQDQPILRELFKGLDRGEHQFHTRVLVENHTFVPVVLHLAFRNSDRYYCIMTPDSKSASRLIGAQQTKVLEALCALPIDSLVRTLAHSLRRWTQSDYVLFIKDPQPLQTVRVLSCSFSDAVTYPKLVVEYLQRRLPKGGFASLARACAASFGFADTLVEPIKSPDGSTWGYLLQFELKNVAIQSVRQLMAHLVAQAAETALSHPHFEHNHHHTDETPRAGASLRERLHRPSNQPESSLAKQAELRATICSLSKEKQALIDAKTAAESSATQQHALLANISHEIRTPLGGIAGIVSLLECTELSETQRTYVAALARSVESMTRIVNDCFDLSGLHAETFKLKIEPTPLLPFIREICLNHRLKVNEKGLRFFVAVPVFFDVIVLADRVRMRQIIDNLMTNAIKFTASGSITIGLHVGPERVRISVQDTGRGISQANLENVFRRFFQESKATETHCSGLGIGLTISRQLVELMDGTIRAENNPEGQGAVFDVSFPVHEKRMRLAGYSASLLEQMVFVIVTADTTLARIALAARDEAIPVYHLVPGQPWRPEQLDGDPLSAPGQRLRFVLIYDNLPASVELATRVQFPPDSREIRLTHNCVPAHPQAGVILEPFCWDDVFAILRLSEGLTASSGATAARGGYGPLNEQAEPLALPSELLPSQAQENLSSAETIAGSTKLRVLLAEDDEVNQFVLKQFLNKLGFAVDIAANGVDALHILEQEPSGHHVYIFDCMMPEMDGLELTRRIRQREREHDEGRRILIALTADAFKGREQKCLEAGFDVFLTKPIQIGHLRKTLCNLILPRQAAVAQGPSQGPSAEAR